MKKLVLIGAGGCGREVVTYVENINKVEPTWDFLGFVDDTNPDIPEDYPILCGIDDYLKMDKDIYFAVAIANPDAREMIAKKCMAAGFKPATIVDPSVTMNSNCKIGEGCIIAAHCSLSTNTTLEPFVILNGYVSLGHDAYIGAYSSMMTYTLTGGNIKVGTHCYFGLRTTMIEKITTTDHCTFGACACIVKDVKEPGTYVGVPAKCIKPLQK